MRESFLRRSGMLRLAAVSAFTLPIPLLPVSLSKAQVGQRTPATAQPCAPDNGGITPGSGGRSQVARSPLFPTPHVAI